MTKKVDTKIEDREVEKLIRQKKMESEALRKMLEKLVRKSNIKK